MAETNNESNFLRKAANAATVIGAGGLVYLAAQTGVNAASANSEAEDAKAKFEISDAHNKAIIDSLGGQFDESQVVGDPFTIEQSEGLETKSLIEIEKAYGDQFSNIKPLLYDDLQTAAKFQVMPQPGERFVVVETGVDPDADNGKEYLPVREGQIIHQGKLDELPPVDTH